MTKRIYSPVEIVAKLQKASLFMAEGCSVTDAIWLIGADEKTYRKWQAQYGGLARALGPVLLPRSKKNRSRKLS
jgi:putative transposase